MRFFQRAVTILFCGVLLLFVLMNSQPIVLRFLFVRGGLTAPLSVVLLAVFLIGVLLGAGALGLAKSFWRDSKKSQD